MANKRITIKVSPSVTAVLEYFDTVAADSQIPALRPVYPVRLEDLVDSYIDGDYESPLTKEESAAYPLPLLRAGAFQRYMREEN